MNEDRIHVKVYAEGLLPKQAHEGDAGFDLTAYGNPKIVGLEHPELKGFFYYIDYIEYDTKVRISPTILGRGSDKKVFSLLFSRSSVSDKNLILANSVGLIDSGYRNNIKLRFKYIVQPWDLEMVEGEFYTVVDRNRIYQDGDRIGQLVFFEQIPVDFVGVSKKEFFADESPRGEGGFGASGK